MDVFDEQLFQFWRTLNNHKVRYIMAGDCAIRFHGISFAANVYGLWLEDKKENRKGLRQAFIDLQYGDIPSLETVEFVSGWTNFQIGQGIYLDIMTSMKGLGHLSFEECFEFASIANLEGISIPFLHINHLIQNIQVNNRPKDQIYVQELEKIRNLREKEN